MCEIMEALTYKIKEGFKRILLYELFLRNFVQMRNFFFRSFFSLFIQILNADSIQFTDEYTTLTSARRVFVNFLRKNNQFTIQLFLTKEHENGIISAATRGTVSLSFFSLIHK